MSQGGSLVQARRFRRFRRFRATDVMQTLQPPAEPATRLYVVRDKVFVASKNQVNGFSKKGRNFYSIQTLMSETIVSMYIYDNQLHVAGDSVYCHYLDSKEQPSFVSHGALRDVCPVVIPGISTYPKWRPAPDGNQHVPVPVLACGDRALRIVLGNEVQLKVPLPFNASVLCACNSVLGGVAYGTTCGRLGAIVISVDAGGGDVTFSELWRIDPDERVGAVTALCNTNITTSTSNGYYFIVGHECGTVRIFRAESRESPELVSHISVGSAITSVSAGLVSSQAAYDVVVASYSGAITGFSVQESHKECVADTVASYTSQIASLQSEIDIISDSLLAQRAVVAAAKSNTAKSAAKCGGLAESVPDVRDSLVLDEHEALHVLTIEIPVSIELIVLRSDVALELVDSRDECGSAVSHAANEDSSKLLAIYTCPPGISRLQLRLRSLEGQYGTLETLIVPHTRPKVCCRRTYTVCALSLHQRVSKVLDESVPLNTLTISGSFGVSEVHAWLHLCFPEMPIRPAGESCTVVYQSTFAETQVECKYSEGTAAFRSPCTTTIAIIRDTISKEATLKNIHIKISSRPQMDSVASVLRLLAPRFEHFHDLMHNFNLLGPLKELIAHEGNDLFLSSEQRNILDRADDITSKHYEQPFHRTRLHNRVLRLYEDYCHAFSKDPVRRGEIQDLLQHNASVEELIQYFLK